MYAFLMQTVGPTPSTRWVSDKSNREAHLLVQLMEDVLFAFTEDSWLQIMEAGELYGTCL